MASSPSSRGNGNPEVFKIPGFRSRNPGFDPGLPGTTFEICCGFLRHHTRSTQAIQPPNCAEIFLNPFDEDESFFQVTALEDGEFR